MNLVKLFEYKTNYQNALLEKAIPIYINPAFIESVQYDFIHNRNDIVIIHMSNNTNHFVEGDVMTVLNHLNAFVR